MLTCNHSIYYQLLSTYLLYTISHILTIHSQSTYVPCYYQSLTSDIFKMDSTMQDNYCQLENYVVTILIMESAIRAISSSVLLFPNDIRIVPFA